jgi:hypothetical protein
LDAVSYQWQKDGIEITGATTNIYNINSVTNADAGNYACIAFDACGSVTSNNAILSINQSLVAITGQPESATVCEGSEATFSIVALDAVSYQWQKDGIEITGATSNIYNINSVTSADAGNYACIAFDACGFVTSNNAILSINQSSVAITGQPESATVCEGSEATFSIVALDAVSYQWQKDGIEITGATTNTYIISSVNIDDVSNYTCIVYGDCGSVISNSVTLSLNAATEIMAQPVDINVNSGDKVSFNVLAGGTNLTYQWRFEGVDINGENGAIYEIVSVDENNAGNYDVIVHGECRELISDIAVLSIITSIEELKDYDILIYPNPSGGVFNISNNKNIETAEVIIINLEGKIVYQGKYHSENNVIDLSDKAKGVYIIKINYEGKSIDTQIILK